jgi:hypothetical protein
MLTQTQQWKNEIADAVTESGSAWAVLTAECDQGSQMCFADLSKKGTQMKRIKLSFADFQTPEARRAELIRQLAALDIE